MSQGYTGYTILENAVTIKDSANLDAFSRLRVSNPLTIFSNQFTYDLSPLIFEVYTNNSVDNTVTHSPVDRLANIVSTNPLAGDYIYMQSYEYIPYQPGRSQLVFITFNMFPSGPVNFDSTKVVGLGDNDNGFYFKHNYAGNNRPSFEITSSSGAGADIVDQTTWNLDKLDGTGPSGISLDLRKTQILVIDFQALYVGRVRFGFDIGGQIIYAHEFLHANIFNNSYIATANLPIRVGMESLTATSDSMDFICCSVASEGGLEDSQRFGYNFSLTDSKITLPATLTYLTSIRPLSTFNGITNRTKFILDSIEFTNTGNKPAYYQLGIGANLITTTYNPYNLSYSAFEVDTTGTSAAVPSLIFESGHVPSGGGSKTAAISTSITSKYPITLDAAGNPRDLGTLYLYAYGIGGTTDLYYSIKWKEIR